MLLARAACQCQCERTIAVDVAGVHRGPAHNHAHPQAPNAGGIGSWTTKGAADRQNASRVHSEREASRHVPGVERTSANVDKNALGENFTYESSWKLVEATNSRESAWELFETTNSRESSCKLVEATNSRDVKFSPSMHNSVMRVDLSWRQGWWPWRGLISAAGLVVLTQLGCDAKARKHLCHCGHAPPRLCRLASYVISFLNR